MQRTQSMLDTTYRGPTVSESHDSTYYTTSDWLGPGQKNYIHGDHCVLKTRYRETTVCGSPDPRYSTISDWLCPGQHQKANNCIQGENCVFNE